MICAVIILIMPIYVCIYIFFVVGTCICNSWSIKNQGQLGPRNNKLINLEWPKYILGCLNSSLVQLCSTFGQCVRMSSFVRITE